MMCRKSQSGHHGLDVGIPAITRKANIVVGSVLISQHDFVCCMGWQKGRFSLPTGCGLTQTKLMLGNMLCALLWLEA